MMNKKATGKEAAIRLLFLHSRRRTDEKLGQNNQLPVGDSNKERVECKSDALPLELNLVNDRKPLQLQRLCSE
jgi:hypothetical protein